MVEARDQAMRLHSHYTRDTISGDCCSNITCSTYLSNKIIPIFNIVPRSSSATFQYIVGSGYEINLYFTLQHRDDFLIYSLSTTKSKSSNLT